ncbi:MAG: lipopolysaccharide transport system ATP-binding protein [Acidimicrobiaceae bacterium]|jgi:lipopolysaccharide transport system ATP-binding protein
MTTPAILTQGLSKRYELGSIERFATFRDAIVRAAGAPIRALRGRGQAKAPSSKDSIWALNEVSIEIAEGDVVGFIGRNGAGKSTLLKIISRITAPTAGHVEIFGRVGALLEVGTGFHPELTGRENIFLNGAILGMTRAETRRKLDAIIDFSGVEPFLETPVKRFSSGMQVRLAFSVAAHLDPEILIVDEVLAVGDIEFQRKCLGKMGDFARDGRTVLFVSHNMGIVQSLCRRSVFLEKGRVVADGPVRDVVGHYLHTLEEAVKVDLSERTDRDPRSNWYVKLQRVLVVGEDGESLATGRPARFEVELDGVTPRMSCRIVLRDALGIAVATFDSGVVSPKDRLDPGQGSRFVCEIDELPLSPGRYRVDLLVRDDLRVQDGIEAAAFFHVESGMFGDRSIRVEDTLGPVAIEHRWTSSPRQ